MSLKHVNYLIFALAVLVTKPCFSQSIIHVPDDYSSISEAIAAAVTDDSIVVRDGVYAGTGNVDLNPMGKSLEITSENGAGSCFIECGNSARAFVFETGEDFNCVVRGFTIRHGSAEDFGGAIYCLNSSPTIDDCSFENNAAGYGAAISAVNGSPHITQCRFMNNTATYYGGAVFLANSLSMISNSYIAWNYADAGGGIYSCWFSQPRLINTLLIWNSADRGGALAMEYMGFADLVNCTLSDNTGSGLFCQWGNCAVTNSIVYGNSPEQIVADDSSPVITWSCIEDGYAGQGNIDADPLWTVGPQGEYYLGDANGTVTNPCINAGNMPAEDLCWTVVDDMVCLDEYTTDATMTVDTDMVDLGYHYIASSECLRTGVSFVGPEFEPSIGDNVGLKVQACNPGDITHVGLNLFVIMEQGGVFWFYPGWTESDWLPVDLVPGINEWVIHEEITWSETPPDWYGNVFYAGLTNPAITEMFGEIGLFPYRFDM